MARGDKPPSAPSDAPRWDLAPLVAALTAAAAEPAHRDRIADLARAVADLCAAAEGRENGHLPARVGEAIVDVRTRLRHAIPSASHGMSGRPL